MHPEEKPWTLSALDFLTTKHTLVIKLEGKQISPRRFYELLSTIIIAPSDGLEEAYAHWESGKPPGFRDEPQLRASEDTDSEPPPRRPRAGAHNAGASARGPNGQRGANLSHNSHKTIKPSVKVSSSLAGRSPACAGAHESKTETSCREKGGAALKRTPRTPKTRRLPR